jgi:4-carboxymuconolactone decarboxylase
MIDEEVQRIVDDFKVTVGIMRKEEPEVTISFLDLLRNTRKDGAIPIKQKELSCLGIALCIRCESCIVLHTKSAIECGATRKEIVEICALAVMMGGSQIMPYTSLVFKSYKKFVSQE